MTSNSQEVIVLMEAVMGTLHIAANSPNTSSILNSLSVTCLPLWFVINDFALPDNIK